MSRKAQSNPAWYDLDNAAKLYPATRSRDWGAVYRMACYLDEDVDPERLQKALGATLPRFPMFAVSLWRGFFWYYHETLRGAPRVEEETAFPCVMIDALDNDSFLFRVLYWKRRISVEFFHSLADGTGAITFLRTLVAEYLSQGGLPVPATHGILDRRERPVAEESEDAFRRHAGSAAGGSFRETKAWELPFEALPPPWLRVTHGIVDSGSLAAAAKARGATITALLAAVLQLSFDEVQREEEGRPQRPVKVSIPVNMRKIHPSRTLRNFSLFTNAPLPVADYPPSLDEAVRAVGEAMAKGLEPAVLDRMMSLNVGAELSPALKPVPLFVKRLAIKAANSFVGENQFTASLSNIGLVELPEAMRGRVTRFDFVLGRSRKGNVNCGVVGYGGKVVISLSSSVAERDVEEGFFRRLRDLGIDIALETNVEQGDGPDAPTADGASSTAGAAGAPVTAVASVAGLPAYPVVPAVGTLPVRRRALDRAAGAAAVLSSSFLVFLNLVCGPAGSPWSAYAAGAILSAWALWRAPSSLPKPRFPYLVLLVEGLSLGYLGLVALLSQGGGWYLSFLVPSMALAASTVLGANAASGDRSFKKTYVPLALSLCLGLLSFPLAALGGGSITFAAITFFLSGAGLAVAAWRGRKWWRNELRRKFRL